MSNYSFAAHAASDRRKWVAVSIAILLIIAIIVTGTLTNWFTEWNKFCLFGHDYDEDGICTRCGAEKPDEVKKDDSKKDDNSKDTDDKAAVNGGSLATVLPGNGISLIANKMDFIAGVPTSVVENTWELTATVNKTADNKAVDWTAEWVDPSSEFASGKDVNEYITVTPTFDGALTATAKVLKDFGEQIKVIVTARDTTAGVKKAECLFDYVQKLTGITFNMADIVAGNNTFSYDVQSTQYTVSAEINLSFSTLSISQNLSSAYSSYLDSYYSDDYCTSEADKMVTYLMGPKIEVSGNTLTLKPSHHLFDDLNKFKDVPLTPLVEDLHSSSPHLFSVMAYYDDEFVDDRYQIDRADNLLTAVLIENDYDFDYILKCILNKCSGYHASFELTYTATYGGKTYSSGIQTVQVNFDRESLYVPVRDLTLDQSHIYA